MIGRRRHSSTRSFRSRPITFLLKQPSREGGFLAAYISIDGSVGHRDKVSFKSFADCAEGTSEDSCISLNGVSGWTKPG